MTNRELLEELKKYDEFVNTEKLQDILSLEICFEAKKAQHIETYNTMYKYVKQKKDISVLSSRYHEEELVIKEMEYKLRILKQKR